ncbi:hypothetical protein ABEB36_009119 [Hypothenemus hampei]|uniref:PIH1 domain-containing protein 1 n=1 Tax=Hypothenemus hampei TaxID=57062 RepID=A0ABD1ES68_HYPHA
MSNSKAIFLDVDSSIVENNLRLEKNSEDEFNKLFEGADYEYPSKVVKPHPGLCIKAKEISSDVKVFVNICTTDAIPPPKDISETELEELIEGEDASDFRVPMSIGEIRKEKDKSDNDAKVVDIAIHPSFLKKIEYFPLFKNFFIAVVFQGILDKHGLLCADKKIILTNRKAFGTLQMHRIQQRDVDEKMGKIKENNVIEQLRGEKKKVVIETLSSVENKYKEPEYRLFKKKIGPNYLYGEFKLPDIISANEITMDIGEDRIVLEAQSKGYFLDIFLPYCVRSEKCSSFFDKAIKVLTVEMPLIGG